MGMTYVQKILARASGNSAVAVGDIVEPTVDLAMSHENAALVINQFHEMYRDTGIAAEVWDRERIAIVFDHRIPAESAKTAGNQKLVREFVERQGIVKFHDIRGDIGGICHQVLPEYGYVLPRSVVVGTDSHTTSHGALGAFAFGVGATEMASIWALGKVLNVEVPGSIRANITGAFKPFVGPKDLILHLIGLLTAEGANFKVIEFHGDTIRNMSTSGRLVLCNMSVEAGATSGIVPPDQETYRYLSRRMARQCDIEIDVPDIDAEYEKSIDVDVTVLNPQIACPHAVDNIEDVSKLAGKVVHQIVIGSCTNGRLDDIGSAAKILKDKTVARGTRLLVFPASWRIYRQALERGYLSALSQSGAVICNPGCGPCLGVHQGALADNETALATTNRNFKGRMGNSNAEIYLCSPAVAAASAITGVITDPSMGVR